MTTEVKSMTTDADRATKDVNCDSTKVVPRSTCVKRVTTYVRVQNALMIGR